MKTILATAYAVNPYKGSEDGMGWNFVLQIARFNRVIAITRENNRPNIEKYMSENPNPLYQNLRFLYFDLPYWMRFWKKGGRGAMIYYLLWQWSVVAFVKKQALHFDIAHNLNFHNDWTPSFLWKLGKPFVWGPVGHHPLIPYTYLRAYDRSYWVKDRLTWLVKQFFWKYAASLRRTIHKADHILCMNSSVPTTLGIRGRYSIVPSVATQDFGWAGIETAKEQFSLISAGRFVPLKGFDLSIRSFALFYHSLPENGQEKCDLTLVGSGPEAGFLAALAAELKVAHKVRFIAWMERSELMEKFKSAAAFLFPSHEGAGMVVAEALSFGLPVICLDNEGPGQFIHTHCGYAVAHADDKATVAGLAKAIGDLHASPQKRQQMSLAARQQFENVFHWDRRGEQLQEIYARL
jgi:glycosyltransferase involved in cell wall biosynthesis